MPKKNIRKVKDNNKIQSKPKKEKVKKVEEAQEEESQEEIEQRIIRKCGSVEMYGECEDGYESFNEDE